MSSQNPSWRTTFALINSMIGGTMLTLPILFRDAGIGIGVIILIISGWISYKTCSLYVIHMSQKEETIQDTIRRLLGRKGQNFFKLITGIYLVFLNIIYVDLIVDQFFNILYFIFHKTGHQDWITQKNLVKIVFDKMSIQIISLIAFLPLLLTMFIKDLSFLVKLTALGVASVFTYTIYIFYKFFSNIQNMHGDNIPPFFTTNFGNLVGTSAVAFTIHTVVNPITKANLIQANNLRDLKVSYICGFFIYTVIGVLGSLAISGFQCKVTILNCFLEQFMTLVVEIVYFLMLLTVFPCFINVGRTRLLSRLFGSVQEKHVKIFNIGFMTISILFAFLSPYLRLDLLMNLVGAILCFFFIYYIPIRFHLACLYYPQDGQDSTSVLTDSVSSDRTSLQDQSLLKDDAPVQTVKIHGPVHCAHAANYVDKRSKNFRLISYSIILGIGVALGVYGLYDVVQQIISSIVGEN